MYNGQRQPWNPTQPPQPGYGGPPSAMAPPSGPKAAQEPYGRGPPTQVPAYRPPGPQSVPYQQQTGPPPPALVQRYESQAPGPYQQGPPPQDFSQHQQGMNEATASMGQMRISQQQVPPGGGQLMMPTGEGPSQPRTTYPQQQQQYPGPPPQQQQQQYPGPQQNQPPQRPMQPSYPGHYQQQPPPTQFPGQQQQTQFPSTGPMPPNPNVPPASTIGQPPPTQRYSGPPVSTFPQAGLAGPPQFAPGRQLSQERPGPMPMGPGMMNPGNRQPPQQMQRPGGPGMPMAGPGMGGPPSPASSRAFQQPQAATPSLENMPSAIAYYEADAENRGSLPYMTNDRTLPPLITTNYKVVDNGNCSPRFMRPTLYVAPCSNDQLNISKIPFAVVIQPFATVPDDEKTIRLVDHGPNGPIRSRRGRAYINPFVQFIDGGRQYVDRFDGFTNEVPPEYFCHLDHQGRRADLPERPELCYGSVEFVATEEYCKEKKMPLSPAYLFLIDVSYNSVRSGLLSLWASTMMTLLDDLPKEEGQDASTIQIGFITYSKAIHFYNVKASLAQPQMLILSDIEDVFMPLLEGFTVNVEEARTVIESLLQQLPEMYANSTETEAVLGPAVRAGLEALKAAGRPGKLFVFHSAFPSYEGSGKLKNREEKKLLGTDKEKTQYAHQSPYYRKVAEECVGAGVSVDLFLFPNCYMDIATIGTLTSTTGGRLYKYNYFRAAVDGDRFVEDLTYRLQEPVAFDAVVRVRCSPGIRAVDVFGSFFMNNSTDIQLAAVDPRTSIAVDIKHDDKLDEKDGAYVQAAMLYTSLSGQRRIRVHNLSLSCSPQLADLYRNADIHSLLNFFAKKAVHLMLSTPYKTIRERLTDQCAEILACYRKHCAAPSNAGQLILPECMKLLPLYANCLLKHEALRGAGDMSVDMKSWLMQLISSSNLASCLALLYPRLFPLHDVEPNQADLPRLLRCSYMFLRSQGVYLLENGINAFIWVGQDVRAEFLQQVFGAPSFHHLEAEKLTTLPSLGNPLSHQIRGIIDRVRKQRQTAMKIMVIKQKDKLEGWFRGFLVEDKGTDGSPSYVDYLCHLHREIRELLS